MKNKRFTGTDSEKEMLVVLIHMVDQYLREWEGRIEHDFVSAAEHAVGLLAKHGLIDEEPGGGRWTEAKDELLGYKW